MDNPVHHFVIDEPLGVCWEDQLLCRRVDFGRPVDVDSLQLLRDDGTPVPFQVTDVAATRGGKACSVKVWFWCDLSPDTTAHFRFVRTGARAGVPGPALGPVAARTLTLSNGSFRVKVPGRRVYRKPVNGHRTPGPIVGFGRPGQSWIGHSRWETSLRCRSIATEVVASGPLWTEARVHYAFEHDAAYTMTLRVYRGRDFVEIDEQTALRIDGGWELSLYRGLEPDQFYTHTVCPTLESDGHCFIEAIDTSRDDRIREIQVPAIGTYYVPHLAAYVGLFNSRRRSDGVVGLVGLDGEMWESAMHNRLRLAACTTPDVVLQLPAKSGRRRWALMLSDADDALKTAAHEQSSLLKLRIRHSETRLRDVLPMTLTAAGARETTPRLFSDDILRRARERLAGLPRFQERLEAVESGRVTDPAFGYLMSGKREYAEETKAMILSGLRSFVDCLLNGGGAADCRATTISLSRPIRAWIGMLDLIRRESGLLDDEEGREIERLLLFLAHKMMGQGVWPHRRTALHQDHPESQKPLYSFPGDVLPDLPYWINCLPNFQSDWLIALASIGLAYPEHPQSRAWIERCLEDLDAQFDHFVFESGAWIESMNYALYTLNYYTHFFIMLKDAGLRDYFADERLLRWLAWHVRMLTPPDPRLGGLQTQAPIGNAVFPDGQAAVFNWMAQQIPDRALAGQLTEVWRREGSSEFAHPASTAIFEALLDPDLTPGEFPAFGSTIEPGFGAILRHGEKTSEETFLTFKAGAVFSHYEGDELSFHWHARGVPLCCDYGVYQPASSQWCAHNVVEVPARDMMRRGFLADHYLDESADYLAAEHPGLIRYMEDHPEHYPDPEADRFSKKYNYLDHEAPLGPKVWSSRSLLFVKPHYLVLLDEVEGTTPSRFNIHCVADRLRVKRDRLDFAGRFGIDLSVYVAEPNEFSVEKGRHAPVKGDADHSQLFARVITKGGNRYLTVLYPHTAEESISFSRLSDGVGVQVEGPCGLDRVWLARQRTVCAGEGHQFVGTAAFVRKSEDGVSLHLLRGESLASDGLSIQGSGPVHLHRSPGGEVCVRLTGPARRLTVGSTQAGLKVRSKSRGVRTRAEGSSVILDVAPGPHSIALVEIRSKRSRCARQESRGVDRGSD